MDRLRASLRQPVQVDYIKANTIANKAVSTLFGHPKMVKKESMSPDMLVKRQEVLDSTVDLMGIAERFSLDFSISDAVYRKYVQ